MRFALSDEQQAMQQVMRELLGRLWGPADRRAAWDASRPLDRRVWSALADVGVLDLLVPVAAGGAGADEVALVIAMEEAGRVALPHPLLETAALAAPLVGRPTAAMVGASCAGAPVACAEDVDLLLLLDEGEARVVPVEAVTWRPEATVDASRRRAAIASVEGAGTLLTDDPTALRLAMNRAALSVAAQLVGLARTMLDLAVDHAQQRVQFGVPIGSFQAVKHALADVLMDISFARPAVRRAAWALAADEPDATMMVSAARVAAADAAERAGRSALQVHGAIGYTVEHDLHLYLKRSWALTRSWGTTDEHLDRIASALAI